MKGATPGPNAELTQGAFRMGRGFESRQRDAHLEAPGLVTWGFFVAIKNPQITLRVFL